MALLEVNNLKKIYTTRFGGNQVEALKSMNFSVEEGDHGRVRLWKNDASQYSCRTG